MLFRFLSRLRIRGVHHSAERLGMPRETATEEPRAAVRDVPHTPLSSSHVRVLLNALMRTPVGVVQQVGFLFMLLVAAVEASLPDCSALPTPSIAGRAARTLSLIHISEPTRPY